MMIRNILLAVLVASASALGSLPDLCITEPPLLLVAGESTVQATNHNPIRWDCRAVIHFSNPAFAPITYPYGAGSCYSGSENASFLVPPGVPNGDAFVTWACGVYTQACVRAIISKGCGDPELPALVDGAVDCQSLSTGHRTSNSTGSPITIPTPAITERSTNSRTAPGSAGASTAFSETAAIPKVPTTFTGSAPSRSQTNFSTPAATEGSASASSEPPTTFSETAAIPTMPTTFAGSAPSRLQADFSTPASTEGSATEGGFAEVSNASRVTPPSLARGLLTITRTVTTLITTTLTAAR
ncbi:hypothetical protein ACJZ2D_016420 [Fusarium nematophilum]